MTEEVTESNVLGDAEVIQRTSPASPGAGQDWPPVHTHEAADSQAKERNLTFPRDDLTVAEKQAFLNGEEV